MKNFRKVLSVLIAALMLTTLVVGCGGTAVQKEAPAAADTQKQQVKTVQPEEKKDDASKPTEKKEVLIAYANGELVNAWRVTNQKDMEAQAKKLGVKLVSTDANQDPSKQLADVENLLAQKPAALIIAPLESKALVPVVEMCEKAKVPLIVIDRTIDAEPGKGMYKTEITQSHELSGKLLAEKTVELLTKKNGAPKGNVVHVQGMAGASPVIDANRGWDAVMKAYPDIKVVATADAGFTKEGGLAKMENFLQTFPKGKIDVVRSDYSDMTMGALQAIKAAGRNELLGFVVGEGGHIKAIEAVINGEFSRETQTPPYFGEKAIKSALDIIAGKDVPARQQVDIKIFDLEKKDDAKKYFDEIKGAGLEF